jgi:hypothetical protein
MEVRNQSGLDGNCGLLRGWRSRKKAHSLENEMGEGSRAGTRGLVGDMTAPKIVTPAPPPAAQPSKTPAGLRAAQKACGHKNWADHIDVLTFVERAAEDMKTQKTIAAWLGKTHRALEEALGTNKGENKLRLAYENGRARAEQKHIDVGNSLSPKNAKEVIGWIYFTKAQFGWRDKPENSSTDAPKITFVLPGPMTEAEYLKKLGLDAPIDTRPENQRGLLGGMKDVTPDATGKMPTKVEGGSHKLTPEALAATKTPPPALPAPPAEPFKPKLD